jgi:hypothetical protein
VVGVGSRFRRQIAEPYEPRIVAWACADVGREPVVADDSVGRMHDGERV